VEPESGEFNDLGIFYCSARQRCPSWPPNGLLATEVSAAGAPPEVLEYIRSKAHLTVASRDLAALRSCLGVCPDICARRLAHGRTPLHLAAALGDVEALRLLLETFSGAYGRNVEIGQAVECYEDGFGVTAGEYAFAAGHQDAFNLLVENACNRPRPSNFCTENNKAYVRQKLKYEGDVLLDATGGGVMMGWEKPLMARHAELVAPRPGLSVLNVGFGLGLVDGFLRERRPKRHTIVEAHPDVYSEMQRRGWLEQEGVQVVHGRWQDVAEEIVANGPYDGIFFDTYAEMYGDMLGFFQLMPRLLRTGGRFSFFNGLSDKNIYAQGISCRVAQMDLASLGLACVFEPFAIGHVGDEEWRKVVNHYWSLETYYIPLAVKLPEGTGLSGAELPSGLRSSAVSVSDQVGRSLDAKLEQAAKSNAKL